jgi:hypothetical protein
VSAGPFLAPVRDGAALADQRADEAHAKARSHLLDIGTAASALSAVGAAAAYDHAMQEVAKWRRVAELLRVMS